MTVLKWLLTFNLSSKTWFSCISFYPLASSIFTIFSLILFYSVPPRISILGPQFLTFLLLIFPDRFPFLPDPVPILASPILTHSLSPNEVFCIHQLLLDLSHGSAALLSILSARRTYKRVLTQNKPQKGICFTGRVALKYLAVWDIYNKYISSL